MANLIKPASKFNDIEVAVGIVANQKGELLIAKRPAHWLGAGFWEFPGGKIEPNEDSRAALVRELAEEVGILVHDCTPLISFTYVYPERKVSLTAWRVQDYSGNASGLEGQEIAWCSPSSLKDVNMLPANRAIVTAIQLPDYYLITPDCTDITAFLTQLDQVLAMNTIKLMQFRSKHLSFQDYLQIAKEVANKCATHSVKLMLNCQHPEMAQDIPLAGIQLRSEQLFALKKRPLSLDRLVGASCHSKEEIEQAQNIGADFAVVSPVVSSVKGQTSLGWDSFSKLVSEANIPIYALGGVNQTNLPLAKSVGAQGIAAMNAFWSAV